MKNLLYKEFKLAFHPILYVIIGIIAIYSLLGILPGGYAFIMTLAGYSILFLGANKGQQSNDLYFTTLLPVRKKDIVKARIIVVMIFAVGTLAISLLSAVVQNVLGFKSIFIEEGELAETLGTFFVSSSFAIIGMGFADLIYLPLYYRNGKSIILPTFLSVLFLTIFLSIFTTVLPIMGAFDALYDSIGAQFALFGGALAVYFGLHYLTYRVSSKLLEKVDF